LSAPLAHACRRVEVFLSFLQPLWHPPKVAANTRTEAPAAGSRTGLVGLWTFTGPGLGGGEGGTRLALDTSGAAPIPQLRLAPPQPRLSASYLLRGRLHCGTNKGFGFDVAICAFLGVLIWDRKGIIACMPPQRRSNRRAGHCSTRSRSPLPRRQLQPQCAAAARPSASVRVLHCPAGGCGRATSAGPAAGRGRLLAGPQRPTGGRGEAASESRI
jgi:hypothetical protein